MTSVIIATHNEKYLWEAVQRLLNGIDPSRLEILICDDASTPKVEVDSTKFPNVRVVRSNAQRGVGYAFDRGIEEAQYDNLVLMGADVMVKDSTWLDKIEEFCTDYPQSIGCSVCLSGDPDHRDPLHPADDEKRYGANVLPYATSDDLRLPISLGNSYSVEMFCAKWRRKEPTERVSEVPTLYGAFYFTTKDWIRHIGGWDTIRGMKLSGLAFWGCVDVFPSIKSWLYGGSCHVVKDIETLHVFKKEEHLNGRADFKFYNRFFTAYTLMEYEDAERLVKKVYSSRLENNNFTYPFNLGKKLLKTNWDYVMKCRERNKKEMKKDFDWYMNKFNIERRW